MSQAKISAALLAALSREVQPFLRRVRARRILEAPLPLWDFPLRGGQGVVALSGIGQSAAARAAAFLIEHYQPQVFISLGFGGGLTADLPHGALVVGETLWRFDPESGALEKLTAPPLPHAAAHLLERLMAAGMPAYPGSVVTTPVIIHKARHGTLLTGLPYPVLDLETSAAAAILRPQQIPFLALRAVTDTGGEEIPDFITQAVREGKSPSAAAALAWLAADPRRLAALLHLWGRSRLAAQHLARALEVVLDMV
jgi:adenosylhomocysteine nucleosidase|uniref:Nucleoside phosphorylase domain-containing protein n=1 Tax=Desulfobacca acetoxidans TaxID=60893 RepID=A0A7V6A4L2_9BACT